MSNGYQFADRTFTIGHSFLEFGKLVTIIRFQIYKGKELLPIVKNADGREYFREYFTHWDNLNPIPQGQLSLFNCRELNGDEPPDPDDFVNLDDFRIAYQEWENAT